MSISQKVADLSRDARAASTEARVDQIATAMLRAAIAESRHGETQVMVMGAIARLAEHVLATGIRDPQNREAARIRFMAVVAELTSAPQRPLVSQDDAS